MPTLIEPPLPVVKQPLQPTDVLKARHRWARWRGVLIAGTIGLAVTLAALLAIHPSMHAPGSWKLPAAIWGGGALLTLVAMALGWRFAPASLIDTAQVIDRRHTTKNRLEASTTFEDATSPLALAQRDETAEFLRRQATGVRAPRIMPWLMSALLVLLVSHLLTLGMWTLPDLMKEAPPAPPLPAKELPKAKITWKSPEPETKANPVEEVPTVATVESTSGMKDLTLEISVNGMPKKSMPLPATPYDKAGKNQLKVSMYMDELQVEPFDVVSYFIRGQRIADGKVPDTTSPIQFIQIRRLRDDVAQGDAMPGGTKDFSLLTQLKLAQLRSVKENFILAHTDLPVTDPVRVRENTRVGKNQGDLSAKTEEIVQAYIQDGIPAEIIDLLKQAEAPMTDASKKILANQNNEALPPQQKALSLIIEIEKYFQKMMSNSPSSQPPSNSPDDPFKDKQKHEMKKRSDAAAGQLETLAKNQAKLSNQLNQSQGDASSPSPDQSKPAPDSGKNDSPGSPSPSGGPGAPKPDSGTQPDAPKPGSNQPAPQAVDPFGPNADKGTMADRQTRIVQGIGTLLNGNQPFPPGVNDALENAQKAATDSMKALNNGDNAGAQEPAATASRELQKALAAMNSAGDQQTKEQMADAQGKLNDLSKQLQNLANKPSPDAKQKLADLEKQVADVRKQLEKGADQQQETGSAAGAQQLQRLAKDITDQKIEKDLDGMSKNGLDPKQALEDAKRLADLAGKAAQNSVGGKPTAEDYAKLINALERSRANLARLADQANAMHPGDLPKPGDQAGGQQPGKQPGQQPGQQPGDQPGAGTTPKPDAQQGQGEGEGQGPGQKPDPNGKGQGPGEKPDNQPGQGQGESPSQMAQGQGTGQGKPDPNGKGQATDPNGKGQGEGQANDTAQGTGAGASQNSNAGGGDSNGGVSNAGGLGHASRNDNIPPNSTMAQSYREVLADLQDQAQTSQLVLPDSQAAHDLKGQLSHMDADTKYREVNPTNVVHSYQVIGKPLDQLLLELQMASAHAQRDQIVKEPNLDDAPAAYRNAVSDYFEAMSKDYHPDTDEKKADDNSGGGDKDKTKAP